jgi:hypothetical protein
MKTDNLIPKEARIGPSLLVARVPGDKDFEVQPAESTAVLGQPDAKSKAG